MSTSKRVRCKYFAQGSCYKGESCNYIHDLRAPSQNICNFYQKGKCSYGSRCRYEHVKPAVSWHPASTSSTTAQPVVKNSVSQDLPSRIPSGGTKSGHSSLGEFSSSSAPFSTVQSKVRGDVSQGLLSGIPFGGTISKQSCVEDSPPSVPCRLWHGASSSSAPYQLKGPDSVYSLFGKLNLSSKSKPISSSKRPLVSENYDSVDIGEYRSGRQMNISICPMAADGTCSRGENCPDVHGDLCSACGKYCLHPFIPQEREEHVRDCEKKKKQLEALKLSEEVECSVCFDRVLSKPTAGERKFGILSECDHPFCITCIRNWRRSSPASGMDALRACPICRKVSYFVVPSETWFTTKEEKAQIIDNYKERLKSIDCKHFSFGNGNCPFGTSCFYKHTVKPGSYTWIHNKPPPSTRGRRNSRMNVESMLDMFGSDGMAQLMADVDDDYDDDYMLYTLEDLIDPSDYGIDENDPFEMRFLLHHLGFDSTDDDDDDDGDGDGGDDDGDSDEDDDY